MSKRRRSSSSPPLRSTRLGDPESSRWTVPVAFVIAFILLLILFSDFVFSDKMLAGSDTLQAGYFYRQYMTEHIQREGLSIPKWDPYIFGGIPYIEAFHGDILYPPSFLGKLIGAWQSNLYRMLGWGLFWHIFLAGLFMYGCARQFKLSKTAALFAGMSYMFTGYIISLVAPGHDGKLFVTALFPLAMLFLHRGFEKQPLFSFSMMGVVIGFIVLTPHPQMSYYSLWALCLYTIYRLALMVKERTPLIKVGVRGAFTAYAVVIGLLLAAIQFWPGYLYTSNFSPRSDTKTGWDWSTSWSMHEEEALSLLIPEFCGTSSQSATTYYWGENAFKDNSEAVGIVPLFVGLIGLFFSRRRERWFFGGLALFALSYALAATTPLYHLYFLIPKVASMRAASMIMFLFCFSVAMLAGIGLDSLVEARKDRLKQSSRLAYLLCGFPAIMFVLALAFGTAGRGLLRVWTSMFHKTASLTNAQGLSKLEIAYANLPAIQSGAWIGFLLVAAAAGIIWLYREKKVGPAILLGLILLVAIDGVRFNSRFIDTIEFERRFGDTPLTEFMVSRDGHDRVLDLRGRTSIQSLELPLHGVAVPAGYHGNQLRWYDELLGNVADPTTGQQRFDNPNVLKPRLINLLGNRYLILPANQNLPPGFLGPQAVNSLQAFGRYYVLENFNALPRVFLAKDFRVIEDRRALISQIIEGTTDLKSVVLLEAEPNLLVDTAALVTGDTAVIATYEQDRIVVTTQASGDRLLVLTDVWYDAWKVTVDGTPVACLRAYGALRAVSVPKGSHEVVFTFESERYRLGKSISGITAIYLIAVFGLTAVQSRRRRKSGEETAL